MIAEWHIYASGPNQKTKNGVKGQKYWKGDGTGDNGNNQVKDAIKEATDFTDTFNLTTLLGAWMPQDNKEGDLDEWEVIKFARYFTKKLKQNNIPWCVNVLDVYYDTAPTKGPSI